MKANGFRSLGRTSTVDVLSSVGPGEAYILIRSNGDQSWVAKRRGAGPQGLASPTERSRKAELRAEGLGLAWTEARLREAGRKSRRRTEEDLSRSASGLVSVRSTDLGGLSPVPSNRGDGGGNGGGGGNPTLFDTLTPQDSRAIYVPDTCYRTPEVVPKRKPVPASDDTTPVAA